MYKELREAWSTLTAPGGQFELHEVEVRGQKLRAYKNAPPTLREVWLLSAGHADKDYLVYGDERWSYARAHQEVASIANWLLAHGAQPGDRVAIAMRNYPEWMLAYWACTSVGVAAVGMNAWWTGPELAFGIQDSEPKIIIADRERLERLERFAAHRDELGDRQLVGVRVDADAFGVTPWSELTASRDPLPEIAVDPDADACIFYTSGTTGRPKGAQLTHRGCVNNIMSMAFANTVQPMAIAAARASNAARPEAVAAAHDSSEASDSPYGEAPSAMIATPLFHVTANNCVAQPMTILGGKLVHMYKWDAAEALRLIETERVTAFSGVPVMAREIIAHPDFATRDTSSLKTLAGGGAQVQPDLVRKIEGTGKSARAATGYGMTETCGIITSVSADFFLDKPDSAGPAMPCYETKVVDAEGRALPAGEVGELCVRGAQVIKGYLNRAEATAETISDGWLRTGDIARLDEEGFIFIVDRAKDMVLRGGENIFCAEVESAIFEQDGVAECTVFGVPDDRLGEEVGVAIMTQSDEVPQDFADRLRKSLEANLAKFKIPRYIWIQRDSLPRNASGKFLKRELREKLDPRDAV